MYGIICIINTLEILLGSLGPGYCVRYTVCCMYIINTLVFMLCFHGPRDIVYGISNTLEFLLCVPGPRDIVYGISNTLEFLLCFPGPRDVVYGKSNNLEFL